MMVPKTPWLSPEEQRWAVEGFLRYGLLKYSNNRSFPLKKGGFTDIYFAARDARNNPEATDFLAKLYAMALKRIDPDRFVEVPDAVSGIAGHLSVISGKPYLTIREQSKEGRVADAKIVGTIVPGEEIVILDDVITDGASKLAPYQECLNKNLKCLAILVIIDRQQGWEEKFNELGIKTTVCAGMTLHDVRRCLIELGKLQRCDPETEKKNPIIVAIDGVGWDEALPILDPLRTTGCIIKVNDWIFNEGFENLLPELSVYGRVMVDIKSHDITNTVGNTFRRLAKYKPWAVTIHASAGKKKISEAVKQSRDYGIKVLAITLLTDIGYDECMKIYNRNAHDQVMAMATLAVGAGAHGLVCSAEEVMDLSTNFPGILLVVPGIRSPDKDTDEHERKGTPKQVIKDGASYIVMGRQILQSPNPVAEVNRILTEELEITL